MEHDGRIDHVSDTALWVATYRARESERPGALFRDPLAAKLAGERGRKIADAMPYSNIIEWALIVRTVAIDGLISKAVHDGADAVINLGAGLDTRPYRMRLPPSLRWVEVDFPNMIDLKNRELRDQTPVCKLEREACDLSNREARKALLAKLGRETRNAVILTEGLIYYLSAENAAELAVDLLAQPSFRHWIQDYRNGGGGKWRPRKWNARFKDAPMKFEEADWLGFFEKRGWEIEQNVLAADEAERIGRPAPMPFLWRLFMRLLPARKKEAFRKSYGYVMSRRP